MQPSPTAETTGPSAPSLRVDIDGDDIGVEVDRGLPLLVRAEAAALDATEGDVHLRACRLRVDVENPRLRLALEAQRTAEARREDRRRQPELRCVGARERIVEVAAGIQRSDRPE